MRTRNLFFAAMLSVLSLGFSSCSDSEDTIATGTLTVDPTYTTKGIETDVESAIVEVPISCNGQWVADVDSCDWLDILDEGSPIHKGNGVLKLKFDENRTGAGRKGKLYVVDFNHNLIVIPVYQTNLYRGEIPTNSVANWFNSKNIGCIADYSYFMEPKESRQATFDPTNVSKNNNIFNMSIIESLQKKGSLSDPLFINTRIPVAKLDDHELVNSLRKSESLDVTIEMGCSFGFIEFQGKGQYTSSMTNNSDKVNYSICREAPVLNCNLQVQNIVSIVDESLDEYYSDVNLGKKMATLASELKNTPDSLPTVRRALKNSMKRINKPTLGGVFSKGFADTYWNLYYANYIKEALYPNDPESQKASLKSALDALDRKFGPYFISGGEFGGSLNLLATVDKKELNEDAKFLAEISANISSIFNLEGSVTFSSEGQQIYKKSDVQMTVYGGNAAQTANDVKALLDGENMTRTDSLAAILDRWADSFAKFDGETDEATPTHAAPILFRITPIWTLFSYDDDLPGIVEDYFLEKYAAKGIEHWSSIYSGEEAAKVEDLLRDLAKSKKSSSTPSTRTDNK